MDGWGLGPAAQLLLALFADAIGAMTYLLPLVGELADVVWAPVQAYLVYSMLSNDPAVWSYTSLAFAEEILPFTDIVPSVTIAWLHKHTGWF